MLKEIKKELAALANKKQAEILQRFFKTGPGEYGEGDIFLGIKVPVQRKVAAKYMNMSLVDVEKLLHSKIHEYRLVAVIILVNKFQRGEQEQKEKIYRLYLKNSNWINNWDLVDLSAHKIVGEYLLTKVPSRGGDLGEGARNRDSKINNNKSKDATPPALSGTPLRRGALDKLANSKLLWERRIAVIATFAFIRVGQFEDTLKLARMLLKDEHDLMHKAVGWMLREIGKKSDKGYKELIKFLDSYTPKMPRTMLRYAIERLPEKKRLYYLNLGK